MMSNIKLHILACYHGNQIVKTTQNIQKSSFPDKTQTLLKDFSAILEMFLMAILLVVRLQWKLKFD